MTEQFISGIAKKKGITKKDLFNKNHYSLVVGGTNTGKTTFITGPLANILECEPKEILIAAPFLAIQNQLIAKGTAEKHNLSEDFFQIENVTVCTYAALKNAVKNKNLSAQFKYFVFDEAHNLITAEKYAEYGSFFLKWIGDNNIQALFLTATPVALLSYKHGTKHFKEVLGVKSNVKVGNIIFTTEKDLLTHVKYFGRKKMFIAVQTVADAQKLEAQINQRIPGKAKAIFSKTHDKATDEMKLISDEIVRTEQFPENVDFLIVTGAYIEGMELQTKCESALIKLPSVTQIVQAVGRLRKGVEDVVVVLSKDKFYAETKRLFEEFDKFLQEYRKANETTKYAMLLGMYSVQKKRFQHEFVNIHSMDGYVADYQINMPLYHSFEINLYDAQRLYCHNDEISNEQFEKLENMFKPYFPDSKFVRLTQEGIVSKENDYDNDMKAFLQDLNGERIYTKENKNGITINSMCRKVMQLREKHNIIAKRPVESTRALSNAISKYNYELGKRNSERTAEGKVEFYKINCTQKHS
ncbi:DEAD/DEAH box helicase [Planococcus sp. X10-3]|uniref:DEAD/DEAH box helicase n=1 Tax=Planococcus sp. X10-3 TaxID=3061240 RepID=UPI003BB16C3B